MMENQQHPPPLLLHKLQTALNCLYGNNNTTHGNHNNNSAAEAHDFLLAYKSNNIRRTVASKVQSQKDSGGGSSNFIIEDEHSSMCVGSIYLSSLALLLQQTTSPHNTTTTTTTNDNNSHFEKIFAAQTINSKCRSTKLNETFDIEAEDGIECGVARLVLVWEEIRTMEKRNHQQSSSELNEKATSVLNAWLERYVPMTVNRCKAGSISNDSIILRGAELLELVLQRNSTSLLETVNIANNNELKDGDKREEGIKGTLIMLTLAVALYVSIFSDYEEQHVHNQQQQGHHARTPWANAVCAELGSAMSVTALRIRYKPLNKDKYATPNPEPSCLPLIDMLIGAVNLVKESAEVYFEHKIQQQRQQQKQNVDHAVLQSAIQHAHHHSIKRCIAAVIKALPETVLLPPGQEDGGHRVPSVDRASLRAASMELRSDGTGMDRAWSVLVESEQQQGTGEHQIQQQDTTASQLLECCESWARYVVVPIPVIDVTVGSLVVRYLMHASNTTTSVQSQKAQTAAFQYLVSIFESASPSLTSNDILTAALGVGASGHRGKGSNNNNANTKKKQGNKSKKRQDKRLGRAIAVSENSDGGSEDAAEKDLLSRRNAACYAAASVFGISLTDGSTLDNESSLRLAATSPATSSHGICSTVASAATSVLPHLLYLERCDGHLNQNWGLELFSTITTVICRMCASSNREMRALAYEPLMTLHTSLNSVEAVSHRMEQVAIDAISECILALASSCGYPHGYFDCLSEDNDEELEIERNDVRDVARSVCSLDSADIGAHKPSMLILERTINACSTAIQESLSKNHLPSETVVHILSALAKPLNKLGKKYTQQPSDFGCSIMGTAMRSMGSVCDQLNSSFDSRPMSEVLPLSRLVLMGMSSLAPMLSALVKGMNEQATTTRSDKEKELCIVFKRTFLSSLQHAILSASKIPELAAESSLQSTRYDIRGCMRSPGGEDHVGCIALLRLSHESDHLTNAIFDVYGSAIFHDLSSLHQEMKTSESSRGVGVDYGVGVCPVSRRMVLRVISLLALHHMKHTNDQSGLAVLQQLLQIPLLEMRKQKGADASAENLFRVCEAAFDLSYFSPSLLADLFNSYSSDLSVMFECVIVGYSNLSFTAKSDDMCHQWGRLRGGVHSVLLASIKESITDYSANMITALVKAECEAARLQCNQGPNSGSNLFNDNIVGEDMVNAGVYIMLIKACLDRIAKKNDEAVEKDAIECVKCLSILTSVAPIVMSLLMHPSPEANSHVDPRPTICEAYYEAARSLVLVCRKHEQIASSLGMKVEDLIGKSLSVVMALILMKDMGNKKSSSDPFQKGMSLDGPHTLTMESFVSESLLLGPSILSKGCTEILSVIQIDNGSFDQSRICPAILVAALLRAVSGALPPWCVEDSPELLQSIYLTIGSSIDAFVQVLNISVKLKASVSFGGIRGGELLAGRYLDVSDTHIKSFISQSKEVCSKGNWKKLKVILKATCGGKKKGTNFNLKPQFTTWECDRL